MASNIILKKSSVVAKVPVAGDLQFGELALNYADGKLYYKKSDGTTIDAFQAGELYSNSQVDIHLNVSTATVNQVLSWNGTDYDWVDQSGGGGGGITTGKAIAMALVFGG